MGSPARNPKKPPKNASFKEYIEYYLKIKGWSQSRLAECARLNQSQLNKIINARVNNVSVDVLVCLCLALQLTVPQSKDLMARAQRTFSPALPKHDAYQKLIALYATMDFSGEEARNILVHADEYLQKRNFPPLSKSTEI
jgi:transcriptional regulator with XRE-family HTH domain